MEFECNLRVEERLLGLEDAGALVLREPLGEDVGELEAALGDGRHEVDGNGAGQVVLQICKKIIKIY